MGLVEPEFKYSEAVGAALGPSRAGAGCILAAAVATLVVVALTPMGLAARALVAGGVAAGSIDAFVAVAARRGRRVARFVLLDRSGAVGVVDAAGRWRTGLVRAGSFVAPWLTILRWRPEGARFDRTILILPDMIDREAFRRLRVLLRWK